MAIFELKIEKDGISATMEPRGDEFLVLEDSTARTKWETNNIGEHHNGTRDLHKKLHDTGILLSKGAYSVFTKDHTFSRVTAAAGVVSGLPKSGTKTWKIKGTNTTYAEWKAAQLA